MIELGDYHIDTLGNIMDIAPKNGKYYSLEELQMTVGGYIELVSLNSFQYMVLNEEGKIMGLPINEMATLLYSQRYYRFEVIVGEVAIVQKKHIR